MFNPFRRSHEVRRERTPAASPVEMLEPRRLLADFAANINFQPESVGPVEFTRADFGRPFDERGNGLSYGWSRDLEEAGDMIDRDSTRQLPGLTVGGRIGNGPEGENEAVDERFDTFARAQAGDQWSIEVPNGTYAVHLVSGDPDFQGNVGTQRHVWTVNGQATMDARPLADHPFGEAIAHVVVTDERITLEAGEEGIESSLSWLRVAQVPALPEYELGQGIDWEVSEEIPSPVRRVEGGSVRIGEKFYVIGGFGEPYTSVYKRVDILDIPTGQWTQGADLPDGAAETHMGFAGDEARGHIYWLTGQIGTGESGQSFNTTRSTWRYVVAEDRWERFVDLPAARYGGAAAIVGDELFFFGGNDETRVTARGDAWKIDLAQDPADDDDDNGVPEQPAWQAIALMPVPGDHLNADAIGGKVYITGSEYGHGVSYVQQRDVQIYDVASDSWRLGAPMPTGSSHNRSLVHDGRIWVFGGQRETQIVLDEVRSYDPAADTWTLHDPMPQMRKAGYVFVEDERFFYVAGDAYRDGFPLRTLIGRLQ